MRCVRHVLQQFTAPAVVLILIAALRGDAGASFFTGFDYTGASDTDDITPFGLGEGEGPNLIGGFTWHPDSTFVEKGSGVVPTFGGSAALVTVDPYDHVQPSQRSVRATTWSHMRATTGAELAGTLATATVSAQVKRSSAPARTQYIVYRPGGLWIACTSNGNVIFGVYANGWTFVSTSYNTLPVGQWHEVRGVYDGSHMYLYVDGTLRATAAKTGTIPTTGNAWYVAGYPSFYSDLTLPADVTDVWITSDARHPLPREQKLASWQFEAGTGTTLPTAIAMPSASPEDATLQNGAAFVDDPALGRAVQLDSSDAYAEAAGIVTSRARGVTAGAWVNLDAAPSGPFGAGAVVGKPNGYVALIDPNLALICRVRDALGTWREASTAGLRTIPLGEWHHVACVSDGDRVQAYIDGKFVSETSGVLGMYTGTDAVSIGHVVYPLPGKVAGAVVYDGAVAPDFGVNQYLARYDWKTAWAQTMPSIVDGYGNATLTNVTWTSDAPEDMPYQSLDVSAGTISIDGRALAGPQEFTLPMWVKLNQGPASSALLASRANAFDLTVEADKTLTWTVKLPRVAQPAVYDSYTVTSGGNALAVGEWQHVAGRFRTTGEAMSVELWLDGFLVGQTTVSHERQRNRAATDDICIGSCNGNSPVNALVTSMHLDLAEPYPYFGDETRPPVPATCDPTDLPLELRSDYVGGTGSGVRHWYVEDASGTRCQRSHPIILVQGNGQEDRSWFMCSERGGGGVIADSQQPGEYLSSWAGSPADCDADLTRRSGTAVWCPDAIEVLTRSGLDVITIDFSKAMADFNDGQATGIAYDEDWMRWSPTTAKCPTCTLRSFPTYYNAAEHIKGDDPIRTEYARRGHPLDQAYILSLLIEYLYNDYSETSGRKPIVVGHSMGGLVANMAVVSRRWFKVSEVYDGQWQSPGNLVLRPDGSGDYLGRDASEDVHAVVTLGSPHRGAKLLTMGGAVDNEPFDSSNFGNVFGEQDYHEDSGLLGGPGSEDDLRPVVWLAFKTAARWGRTPSTEVMVPHEIPGLEGVSGWDDNYRGWIDVAVDEIDGEGKWVPKHYPVAGMYNASWRVAGNPAVCRRIASSEVVRKKDISSWWKWLVGDTHQAQVIEKKAPWHADLRDLDAENRDCVSCGLNPFVCTEAPMDFPLEICQEPKYARYDCGGNQELPVMWRMLSAQQGEEYTSMGSIGLSDMLDGRVYAQISGGGDNFAWGFNLLAAVVTATGLDPANEFSPEHYNDGAVRLESALGLDPYGFVDLDPDPNVDGYPTPIRAVVPKGPEPGGDRCPDYQEPTAPYTDEGLYLNHHQLRKGSAWYYKICDPNFTTQCRPLRMIEWLRSL